MTFLLLVMSTVCFSQVVKEALVGKWKYVNITNLQDSIIESSIMEFELDIIKDRTFKMTGETIRAFGIWELEDLILILDGKRNGESQSKILKMKINKLLDTKLAID